MAIARATGNLSFKVLPNEIRKRFNGTCNYTGPDANDKWIYKKFVVDESSDKIFLTSDEFLGISTSAALVLTNPVRFIMIKHTGFTDTDFDTKTYQYVAVFVEHSSGAYTLFSSIPHKGALFLPHTPALGSSMGYFVAASNNVAGGTSSSSTILTQLVTIT